MKRKLTKTLLVVFKLAILCGLVYIIRQNIDAEKLVEQFRGIRLGYLGLAFLCIVGLVLVMGWRLAYVARVPLGGSMVCMLKAFFYNNFLPAQVGGDVYRVYYLSKKTGETKKGLALVFGDRLIGMTGGVLFALVNVLVGRRYFPDPAVYRAVAIYIGIVAVAFAAVFLLPDSLLERLGKLFRVGQLTEKILLARHYAKTTLRSRALGGLVITWICYLFLIGLNLCAMKALCLEVSVIASVLYMPVLAVIVLTLPISIGGLGVRENLYMYIFAMAGYTPEAGFAMSVVHLVCLVCISVVGGIMAFAAGDRAEAAEVQMD